MESSSTIGQSVPAESITIGELPTIVNVWVDEKLVHFDLQDGRLVAWPIAWSTILTAATPEQRQRFTFSAYHVFWDDIDEIVGVKNILYPSARLLSSGSRSVALHR